MTPSGSATETTRPTRGAPGMRPTTLAVGGVAVVAAVLAGVAGCEPTGGPVTDAVLTALLAATVVALGSRARPLALGVTAAVAVVGGGTLALRGLGLLALVGAGLLSTSVSARLDSDSDSDAESSEGEDPRRVGEHRRGLAWRPVLSALVAAAAVQVLLRMPATEPARATAVVAAASLVPLLVSGWRGLPPPGRALARRAALLAAALFAVGALIGVAAVLLASSSLRTGVDRTDAGIDAIRSGEKDQAGAELRQASEAMGAARDTTGSWWAWPARRLPLVAPQLEALDVIADGGAETADLAADGADRIDADGLQLVDGRLDPEAVAAVGPVLDEVVEGTSRLRRQLDGGVSAAVWQIPPIADGLDRFSEEVAEAEGSARTGALAAELAPQLLGADGEARYFVAFVTPSEARGTGFLGSYGLLTATDGQIDLTTVGRNKDLNAAGAEVKVITGPPDYLDRYSQFEPESTWENVTFTPDGPTAAEVMAELYPQSGGEEVDGVIRIDPFGIARLLRVTGPVTVEGLPFDLDATNVEQFLLVDQYRRFTDRDARVDVLGDVAEAVFDALVDDDSVAPARLARALGPAVRAGGITLWLPTEEGTRLVDRLGVSGAVPPVHGDGFGVVTQNAGGSKIDAFLQRTVRYDAQVDAATGQVRATAQVSLANAAPSSGEPPYIIGNLVGAPPGTNRMYVSLYSPLDLVGIELDGAPVDFVAGRELDRNVWSAFLDVAPGATAEVTVSLEGRVDLSDGTYRFDLLPQVMARPDRVDVAVHVDGGQLASASTTARALDGTELEAVVTDDDTVRLQVPAQQGPLALTARVERRAG